MKRYPVFSVLSIISVCLLAIGLVYNILVCIGIAIAVFFLAIAIALASVAKSEDEEE